MKRSNWFWYLVVDGYGNIKEGFNSQAGAEGYLEEYGSDSDWTWVKVRESNEIGEWKFND